MDRSVGPRLKISRAEKHLSDLNAAVKEFIATDPYTQAPEDDPKTGDLVYKISVQPHAPKGLRDLSVIVGDVVHNLRSALDLLAWQLVEANSGTPGDSTAFPVWRTEGQFLGGGAGYMRGAHPDAIRVLRRMKPYKGGNAAIWRLHRLDATDKHRLLLTVGAMQHETRYHFSVGRFEGSIPIKPQGDRVVLEEGADLFRVRKVDREYFERQPKPEFTLEIGLREVETPHGLEITSCLRDLVSTTAKIVDDFGPFLI